jgi:hypothetical protein
MRISKKFKSLYILVSLLLVALLSTSSKTIPSIQHSSISTCLSVKSDANYDLAFYTQLIEHHLFNEINLALFEKNETHLDEDNQISADEYNYNLFIPYLFFKIWNYFLSAVPNITTTTFFEKNSSSSCSKIFILIGNLRI